MRIGGIEIIMRRRRAFRSNQLVPVGEGVMVAAHMIGIPENMERWGGAFSNKELGDLADIAKRWNVRSSLNSWVETLMTAQVAGTQLSNTTTATSILPTHAVMTFPNTYWLIGRTIRISGMMEVSNVVTTPGTLTLDHRLGAVIAMNSAAMQMSTTAHTTLPLWFTSVGTCRAIGNGTSANIMFQMVASSQVLSVSGADATTGHAILLAPNTTPAVGTGFDSTTAPTLDMFAKFSVATNPTNCKLHIYTVESMN